MVKADHLTRYWIEFDVEHSHGYGVTAFTSDDALGLLRERVFSDELPPVARLVEDIDVSSLDAGHVLPNMSPPNRRGVWFPQGFAEPSAH